MQILKGSLIASRRETFITSRFYLSVTGLWYKDSYDFTCLLEQCKSTRSMKKLHAQIIVEGHEQNPFVASKLIGKYMECSDTSIEVARKLFDGLSKRDVFLWNMVIQGYANLGPFVEAVDLYRRMRLSGLSANKYTYPFVLKACGAMKDVMSGQVVHGQAVKSGLDLVLFVGNALIAFYSKSRDMKASRRAFDEMPQRDIISWNSMISGYTSNGHAKDALMLFCAVVRDHTTCFPDHATLVSTLPACVHTLGIQVGFWIHSYVVQSGMEVDAALCSSLISMYANFGRVSIAKKVFVRSRDKNLEVWSAMMRCYGMNGHADEALKMFQKLLDSGLHPDGVVFLCLLSACSHAGMVEKGCEIFDKMGDFGVQRNEKHYACMVDLFGRAGFIDQAIEFIKSMPVKPGKDVFGALLGACRIHGNVELAEEVAEKLVFLDADNARRYLTLARMYEEKGRWEDAARMRKELREKKIKKLTGTSSIEGNRFRCSFGVEDELTLVSFIEV
ncbi:hypothetical protein TIFTF001_002201 [Ficus carica]|uniref:Pentatricopeptide repeat-containing protein n=1 Tax=Ficus carica TaxID=3494 RepID=A0AA88CNV0_FICCA|nr:hypothetical protein TIFTF001_002201 [Ficus carica]